MWKECINVTQNSIIFSSLMSPHLPSTAEPLTPTRLASAHSFRVSSSEEESTSDSPASDNPLLDSSHLNESVQKANAARVKLISVDKCDVFVINPMFGSGLRYDCPVSYWAESRTADTRSHLSSFSSASSSPHEVGIVFIFIIKDYPIGPYYGWNPDCRS